MTFQGLLDFTANGEYEIAIAILSSIPQYTAELAFLLELNTAE
jgi:hypothetical protein